MPSDEFEVQVELTRDEAYEILMRCLQSDEADTPLFKAALKKLARAIEAPRHPRNEAA
jgi:hypothetical protein